MRNLKKLFAVLLAVAIIATMMVPALAAVSYTEEALKLQAIGLIAGGANDLNLDRGMTRIEGLAFVIRAAGKEDDAFAMTAEEIDEILADWKDADEIPQWPNDNARKYAAYAIKHEITIGVSATEKILAPNAPISGVSFLVFLMKSAMGYADVNTFPDSDDYVLDAAYAAGVLTAGQVVGIGMKAELLRDDAAAILFGAVSNGVNADGKKLIEALIASGDVDAVKAAEAGFVLPAPAKLSAVGASATNLKEIVITFDAELDKDEAEKAANYTVEGNTVTKAKLGADSKSVTLVLGTKMTNQSTYKVTVSSSVKSAAGVALAEDAELSGTAFDVTIPEVLSAEQYGPDSFKVIFSEPVDSAISSNFRVDNGLYFVKNVASADDNYAVIVTLYTTLPTGNHNVEVSGVKDFVPYTCITKTVSFTATKDEAAPVIAQVVSASPEKVVLEFNENIFAVVDNAYIANKVWHTNDNNKAASASIDGKKLTLNFTNKLPNGTAYLTLSKDIVKDAWNNKNAEVKDLAIVVTVDTVKPAVKEAKAENDKKIVITFTEDLSSDEEGKFTILDASGAEVKANDYPRTVAKTDTTRTLNFTNALPGSTYTVVVEGVKDVAGNEIDKVSVPVLVTDTTAPTVTTPGSLYASKKIVKISFNEVMNSDDILNLANYQVGSLYLNTTKATATLTDGGKAVLIDFSKVTEAIFSTEDMHVYVGRVRDAAGNYTANFVTDVTFTNMDLTGITISKVEATGKKTIVVTLSDALSEFDADDFIVNNATVTGVSFTNNADNKGVITFTIDEELTTLAKTSDEKHITVSTTSDALSINSKNSLGVKVAANQTSGNAEDKIGAEIADASFETDTKLNIVFTEAIKADTLSRYTFTVSGNTVTSATYSDVTLTLTLKDAVTSGNKVTVTQVLEIEGADNNVVTGLTKADIDR